MIWPDGSGSGSLLFYQRFNEISEKINILSKIKEVLEKILFYQI
jgi:hypothetical protein